MTFIEYKDELNQTHYFDAERVMFTMTQVSRFDEDGNPEKLLTKVALNENMGFIIADEAPDSIVKRISEALGK